MNDQPPPSTAPRVLVVEDETLFARAVCKRLTRAGYACETAATLAVAASLLNTFRPDLILLDMRLPDGSGLDFLERLPAQGVTAAVVVLTAFGDIEDAVTAMKQGAVDYLQKPLDLDTLAQVAARCLTPAAVPDGEAELLGSGPALARVREQISRIGGLSGRTDTPPTVLLLGETGTGKDMVARLLHRASARRDKPFMHVDCAALPRELIEAELFGHEKGAFTSAHHARVGLIEAADDGTVFLDEIAEVPLELQAKLLAVLERRAFRRVGSSREQPTRAWFIAATHRDLPAQVQAGQFRADLYYRLKVLTLNLPPLRERGSDVELLAERFAARTAQRYGLPVPVLTAEARAALSAYPWPGNVRELAHVIERAVLLGEEQLTAALLLPDAAPVSATGQTLEAAEAALIRRALTETDGNVSEAARKLGITRMTLRYRMQKYGIGAGR